MINSFYTAATSTVQTSKGIDVVANNIANISTNGYKADKTNFSDLLYTKLSKVDGDIKQGNGTKLSSIDTLQGVGTLNATNRTLDFALPNAGEFFAVETRDGVRYTRDGNFSLSEEDGASYLVNGSQNYVLDSNGQRIKVSKEQLDGYDHIIPGVFTFDNYNGLMKVGNTEFATTQVSGQAKNVADPDVRQGVLEGSNVSMSEEMTNAIILQRSFQFNSKMVQIADEVMQNINNLR